jgi:hypothetical protein
VQAWVKKLTGVLAPGSIELVYRWVSTIFKAAGRRPADRLLAVRRHHPPQARQRRGSPAERMRGRSDGGGRPRPVPSPDRLRRRDGVAPSECFGLTVDRVDFLRRQVRVDRQRVSTLYGAPKFGPPKVSNRTVPMPEVVGSALAAHHVPRPTPLLRLAADRSRLLREGRSTTPRPPAGDGDTRHLRSSLARQRRRDP